MISAYDDATATRIAHGYFAGFPPLISVKGRAETRVPHCEEGGGGSDLGLNFISGVVLSFFRFQGKSCTS
jgi:hypothetical protein